MIKRQEASTGLTRQIKFFKSSELVLGQHQCMYLYEKWALVYNKLSNILFSPQELWCFVHWILLAHYMAWHVLRLLMLFFITLYWCKPNCFSLLEIRFTVTSSIHNLYGIPIRVPSSNTTTLLRCNNKCPQLAQAL